MKKKQTYEIEPMDNFKYVFCIGVLSCVMCFLSSCSCLKKLDKNMTSNAHAREQYYAKKRAQ